MSAKQHCGMKALDQKKRQIADLVLMEYVQEKFDTSAFRLKPLLYVQV